MLLLIGEVGGDDDSGNCPRGDSDAYLFDEGTELNQNIGMIAEFGMGFLKSSNQLVSVDGWWFHLCDFGMLIQQFESGLCSGFSFFPYAIGGEA
jgi:hypothetical protein